MEFKEWVQGLVNEHMNPTVKFEINKSKLFNTTNSQDERDSLEERLNSMKKVLNCERVERRCARNKLTWLPQENVARIDKGVGTKFWFMGYHNKTGKFVYPEEALFLLETNRAEISWNSVPINIDRAFTLFISGQRELEMYEAYRKLALRGFEIKRYKEKAGDEAGPSKRAKLHTEEQTLVACSESGVDSEFKQTFERLRSNGPQHNARLIEKPSDYTLEQKLGGSKNDYNLYFMFDDELDPGVGFNKGSSNVYCSVDDDALFFRFVPVELPSLI